MVIGKGTAMREHPLIIMPFFLVFCLLFTSTDLLANNVKVYAHRGGRALWPENTLTAFYNALNLGVDVIDMDINLSKDNVYMVTHDNYLNKDLTRDLTLSWIKKAPAISALKASELKQYNVGKMKNDSEYSLQFPYQVPSQVEYMPTLTEAVEFIKHHQHRSTKFQLEVKTLENKKEFSAEHYANVLYKTLRKERLLFKTEIQSFDYEVLEALNRKDKRLKLAFLTESVPHPSGAKSKNLDSLLSYIKNHGGSFWEPEYKQLTKALVDKAHNLHLNVVVWGFSNKPARERQEIQKAIDLGVDGIITDNPTLQPWIKSLS